LKADPSARLNAVRRCWIPLAACALLAGLLLPACGGKNDGDRDGEAAGADEGTPLSKSEYLERGDQICIEGTLRIAAQSQERFESQRESPEEVGEFALEVVAPTLEDEVGELRALTPPVGDQKIVGAIYDAVDEGIAELRRRPEIILQADVAGAFERANALAQAYGFERCAED
jgi:hypothetical protein